MGSAAATPNPPPARRAAIAAPKAALSCAETRACDGMLPALWGRRPPSASAHRKIRVRDEPGWPRVVAAAAALAVALASCGGDEQRQDADEPSGDFPVKVSSAKFATDQRLAETNDLTLEIENVGDEAVPDLAVTIFTGDQKAGGSFSVRSDQPGLADPNRPVWILENGFPKVAKPGESNAQLDAAAPGGAEAAQTDTFSFGPLDPGDSRDLVWRVTPVVAGTYTVNYELAAGLNGKAKAVTNDGGPVQGEFVVTVSDKPPEARVDDAGNVVTSEK